MPMNSLPGVDARHVDVAILYGLGMKDRAQHIARELRPTTPRGITQLRDAEGNGVAKVSKVGYSIDTSSGTPNVDVSDLPDDGGAPYHG